MAVWPPAEVLDQIGALHRPAVAGLRWAGREQWHVTLRFLGPVPNLEDVGSALAGMGAGAAIAQLGPAVGRFGHRILQVPVGGLEAVAAGVVRATARHGRPPEDRPFYGHLTLARVARQARVDLRPHAGAPIAARWPVTEVCLVESRLSSAGARYEILDRFPLGDR